LLELFVNLYRLELFLTFTMVYSISVGDYF